MAHNKSHRKISSDTLAMRLGDCPRAMLVIVCRCCRVQGLKSVDQLAAHYGRHHTLQAVVSRLRCAHGRDGPSTVSLSAANGQVTPLVGPGSY